MVQGAPPATLSLVRAWLLRRLTEKFPSGSCGTAVHKRARRTACVLQAVFVSGAVEFREATAIGRRHGSNRERHVKTISAGLIHDDSLPLNETIKNSSMKAAASSRCYTSLIALSCLQLLTTLGTTKASNAIRHTKGKLKCATWK
jgi:hypothetical protein